MSRNTIGKKKYKTKNYTVTIENHQDANTDPDLKDFKWVRIYANASTIQYMSGSQLLISCESGRESSLSLLKIARKEAKAKLNNYQEKARAILALSL